VAGGDDAAPPRSRWGRHLCACIEALDDETFSVRPWSIRSMAHCRARDGVGALGPCLRVLRADFVLLSRVMGPRDLAPLRRLASARAAERQMSMGKFLE
jgi:hypothetical protein